MFVLFAAFSLAQVKAEAREIEADAIEEVCMEETSYECPITVTINTIEEPSSQPQEVGQEVASTPEDDVAHVYYSEPPRRTSHVEVVMRTAKSRPNPLLINPDHYKISKERPYACEICLKAFKDVSNLMYFKYQLFMYYTLYQNFH